MSHLERKINAARNILSIMLDEIFWSTYRMDDDLADLKEKTVTVFGKDLTDIMFESIKIYVENFSKMQNTSKNDDLAYISQVVTTLANSIIATQPKLNDLIFET